MSHTDKTRPVWVQVRDPFNRWAMQEKHDHRDGVCNYDEWFDSGEDYWRRPCWGCRLDYSYYGVNVVKFWPRPPKDCWGRVGVHGRMRARWRAERQRLLKAADPADMDYMNPRRKEFLSDLDW